MTYPPGAMRLDEAEPKAEKGIGVAAEEPFEASELLLAVEERQSHELCPSYIM